MFPGRMSAFRGDVPAHDALPVRLFNLDALVLHPPTVVFLHAEPRSLSGHMLSQR